MLVPYHKNIYERSGYLRLDDLSKKLPYSQYQVDERGEIFRRSVHSQTYIHTCMHDIVRHSRFWGTIVLDEICSLLSEWWNVYTHSSTGNSFAFENILPWRIIMITQCMCTYVYAFDNNFLTYSISCNHNGSLHRDQSFVKDLASLQTLMRSNSKTPL